MRRSTGGAVQIRPEIAFNRSVPSAGVVVFLVIIEQTSAVTVPPGRTRVSRQISLPFIFNLCVCVFFPCRASNWAAARGVSRAHPVSPRFTPWILLSRMNWVQRSQNSTIFNRILFTRALSRARAFRDDGKLQYMNKVSLCRDFNIRNSVNWDAGITS